MTGPPPEIIYHVSHTQFSVARHYGGCTFNGHRYVYNPADDTLTREDVWNREERDAKRARREAAAAERAKWEAMRPAFDFGEEPAP